MRCPECRNNQKKSQGTTCGGCGYVFKLVPTENAGIGDHRMISLLETASANGTWAVTPNQLYAVYARKPGKSALVPLVLFVVTAAAAIAIAALARGDGKIMALFFGLAAFVALVVAVLRTKQGPPAREPFLAVVQRWIQRGGKHAELVLREDERLLAEPPPEWREPDVYDYGVTRLVIVERDALADLLVRNGLHTTEQALVLSASGYPDYLLRAAEKALREGPTLPVFVLHDALPAGTALEQPWWWRISRKLSFEGHPVIDLGLSEADIPRMPFLSRLAGAGSGRLPLDSIPWPILGPLLAAAIAAQDTFAEVLAAHGPGSGNGDDGGTWGGDGDFG